MYARAVALEIPVAEEAGDADEHASQIEAVEHRHLAVFALEREQECEAARDLQEQAEGTRQTAILSHAGPQNGGSFERPRRGSPASVQRERDGERGEDDTEREKRFHQQSQAVALAPEQPRCE